MTKALPLALLVDDDVVVAAVLHVVLGNVCRIEQRFDGLAGIAAALCLQPEIVLLDVGLPDIDGYAVCRALKADPRTAAIPVIFISANGAPVDRLHGYEAGGDDYMAKPVRPSEFKAKVEVLLRRREENTRIAAEADAAIRMQMSTLMDAGEAAAVTTFMRNCLGSDDLGSLMNAIFAAIDDLGLSGTVQLRDRGGRLSRNRKGLCSPLEEWLLDRVADPDAIVDAGPRSVCNREHVTLLIHDLRRDDCERHARLMAKLETITDGAESHMKTLIVQEEAAARSDGAMALIQHLTGAIKLVEAENKGLRKRNSEILHGLAAGIEESFVHLGLLDSQERYLQDMTRNAIDASLALYGEEDRIDRLMAELLAEVDGLLGQEVRDAIVAANGHARKIELF